MPTMPPMPPPMPLPGHFELNAFKPLIAACVLRSAALLGDAAASFAAHAVAGAEPQVGARDIFMCLG